MRRRAVAVTIEVARAVPPIPAVTPTSEPGGEPRSLDVRGLRSLVTSGLLRATCGASGGYSLSRPANQITLREIFEAFDNPFELTVDANSLPRQVEARVLDALNRSAKVAGVELEQITLAELAA